VKFSELSTLVKTIAGTFITVVAALAIVWGWGGLLQTDAEAQEHKDDFNSYQMQQFKSDKYDRADRIQREIDRIDYQLLSADLSSEQRQYLNNKRADLVDKIKCIQRDEC
jgi:hypothetical protein